MADAVLVYDDDCGFCTWWAEFIDDRSELRLVGFSDLSPELLAILPDDYEECSHLITDEGVYSCGASIEEALARSEFGPAARPVVETLRKVDGYGTAREAGYRLVADNRSFWGRFLSTTPPSRRDRTDE